MSYIYDYIIYFLDLNYIIHAEYFSVFDFHCINLKIICKILVCKCIFLLYNYQYRLITSTFNIQYKDCTVNKFYNIMMCIALYKPGKCIVKWSCLQITNIPLYIYILPTFSDNDGHQLYCEKNWQITFYFGCIV